MKTNTITTFTAAALAIGLTGCGQKAPTAAVAATQSTASSSGDVAMANMADPAAKTAIVKATITAIDAANGAITLDHEAIAAVNWPAMTMAFKASPAMIAKAKTGEKVEATLKIAGDSGEIMDLKTQ